jgi:hypothetical protein
MSEEMSANGYSLRVIETQQRRGGAPDSGTRLDTFAVPREVPIPVLRARVIEWCELA